MSGKSKKTIQRGSFQRLLKIFFLKNKMLTFLMLFSIVVSAIATALGPQYLGYATDSVVQDMQNPVSSNIHWDRFYYWAAISAGIFLVQFVSKWLSGWFSTRIISDTARELRSQVEDKLWTLPLNYFDTNSHGDIMSRTTNDIDNVVQKAVVLYRHDQRKCGRECKRTQHHKALWAGRKIYREI